MTSAVYTGSFDPVTNGHMDIISRASKIFGRLTVLIVVNSQKSALFSAEERRSHLVYLTRSLNNVDVRLWEGLTVDYMRKENEKTLVRGVRNGTDFDYEAQLSHINKSVFPEIETIFMSASPEFAYLSSTVVKEFLRYGGNIDNMVDSYIKDKLARLS